MKMVDNTSTDLGFARRAISNHWSMNSNRRYTQVGVGIPQREFSLVQNDVADHLINREDVLNVIAKFRQIDETEAEEISIALADIALLKGLDIPYAMRFAARMTTRFGGRKSGEAIARALIPYIGLGGTLNESALSRELYFMSEAVQEDRVVLHGTEDLGVSQTLRLLSYLNKISRTPAITQDFQDLSVFEGFPTIGGEFHGNKQDSDLLRGLLILNMSQYQPRSYVPFSRTDSGVVEIRMNPSYYPFATATWNLMRKIVPEIDNQYYTLCVGRDTDFEMDPEGTRLVPLLRTLGSIVYANMMKDVKPSGTQDGDIEFGSYYLGQIVRFDGEDFSLDGGRGLGNKNKGKGQLNLYSGFGETFPYHAFYLSMACAEPELLKIVEKEAGGAPLSPAEALQMHEVTLRHILRTMNMEIMSHPRLSQAVEYGQRIINQLRYG